MFEAQNLTVHLMSLVDRASSDEYRWRLSAFLMVEP